MSCVIYRKYVLLDITEVYTPTMKLQKFPVY
jgi:hypothetical protein